MHGLSSFEPCDLRKKIIYVTSYYGQRETCGGNLLVGLNTCFLHDKLQSLYTDNQITDERKINLQRKSKIKNIRIYVTNCAKRSVLVERDQVFFLSKQD